MKKNFFVAALLLTTAFLNRSHAQNTTTSCLGVPENRGYSKAAGLQAIMDKYAVKDLPGVSMAVYSEEGWWAGAAGYSKLESKTKMSTCNLQYIQSVAKTYMAVAILKLHEEKKIDFDTPLTTYLPATYSRYIKNADKITIRMLLNHTSGIAEYSIDPEFTALVILHPTTIFKMQDAIKCLANEEPQFAPGSRYLYTNTNYCLLALIADAITGDHAKYIREKIFNPLGLTNTFYRSDTGYLKYTTLTDSYWDILNTGRPANISPLQQANVATMVGDDGIVCTPVDAVKFLKGLMEGKLLHDSSMKIMQQWVNNDAGKPTYGMGLYRFAEAGIVGYGHGGGGIGAGCILLYVPEKKVYLFMATNVGVLFDGLPTKKADELKNEVLATLLF
jgi:D-alanyl-D-alanine carboxypeptidase